MSKDNSDFKRMYFSDVENTVKEILSDTYLESHNL